MSRIKGSIVGGLDAPPRSGSEPGLTEFYQASCRLFPVTAVKSLMLCEATGDFQITPAARALTGSEVSVVANDLAPGALSQRVSLSIRRLGEPAPTWSEVTEGNRLHGAIAHNDAPAVARLAPRH